MSEHPGAEVTSHGCKIVCFQELHQEQLPPGVPGGRHAEAVQVSDLLLPGPPCHVYQQVSTRVPRG